VRECDGCDFIASTIARVAETRLSTRRRLRSAVQRPSPMFPGEVSTIAVGACDFCGPCALIVRIPHDGSSAFHMRGIARQNTTSSPAQILRFTSALPMSPDPPDTAIFVSRL
jgi:hypothetical protein